MLHARHEPIEPDLLDASYERGIDHFRERRQLAVDGRERLRGASLSWHERAGGELRGQLVARLSGPHLEREPALDQRDPQPLLEDVRDDVELGITRRAIRRRRPDDADLIGGRVGLDHHAELVLHAHPRGRRANRDRARAPDRAEPPLHQRSRVIRIEAARDHQRRVRGLVPRLHEPLDVREPDRREIVGHLTGVAVAVPDRIEGARHQGRERPLRAQQLALDALALDDALLFLDGARVERREEERHAIALEEEHRLERGRRNGLVIVGPVERGRGVAIGAPRALERREERVAGRVQRALEHQVLGEVRQPAPALWLVAYADAIGDEHRHLAPPRHRIEHDLEAVLQLEPLGIQGKSARPGGTGRQRARRADGRSRSGRAVRGIQGKSARGVLGARLHDEGAQRGNEHEQRWSSHRRAGYHERPPAGSVDRSATASRLR